MQKAGGAGAIGGWTPASLSNLLGWYSPEGLDSQGYSDTDTVTTWPDSSANGNDLTNTGTPVYSVNQIGSYPGVIFNRASGDTLVSGTISAISPPVHLFLVFEQNTWTDGERITSFQNSTVRFSIMQDNVSPEMKMHNGAATFATNSSNASIDNYRFCEALFDGATSSISNNGEAPLTGNTGANTSTTIQLSNSVVGAGFTITEFIVVDGEVPSDELTELRSYINTKYGLTTI